MRANSDNSPFDYIFIGAGINSLGCAYVLSLKGFRVLLIDRNAEPGGAIRTMPLTLPGYLHDIGAMNLSVLAGSPFFAEHGNALNSHGLELIKADHLFGSFDADGKFLCITTDQEENLKTIGGFSERDAKAWETWRKDFDDCSPSLFEIFGSGDPHSDPAEYVGADSPEALRGILLDSLRENLGRRFETDVMQAVIAAWAMHLDYGPDVRGGCWMPFLESNADERYGIPIAKGGSAHAIKALVSLIEHNGGQLISKAEVERIVISDHHAKGVDLADGRHFVASHGVIASTTPQGLAKLTENQLPDPMLKEAGQFAFGPGTFMIHLALSGPPGWLEEAARKSFYVHIGPSLDYINKAYKVGISGLLPKEPFMVVGQPSVYDSTRAPDGGHALWIMVRAIPANIKGDEAGEIRGRAWDEPTTKQFTDRVIRLLSTHAPDLQQNIKGMAVHTPSDLENLNPNLVGGDLNSGSLHLSQFYGNRPFREYADHKMPVNGLYLCGASTWPGGGATPGSGVILARELLKGV